MEQNNEELNWRDAGWRHRFFNNFIQRLRFCDSENLEPNPQNIEEYNDTRKRCQIILNYYLTRVERIVLQIENTHASREIREIVDNIKVFLERIITNPIFQGIVDQISESVAAELGEDGVNPMLQGNNQIWSELILLNHYNKIHYYYMIIKLYLYLNVEGGRKKYRKSKKAKKSRKAKKRKSKKAKK